MDTRTPRINVAVDFEKGRGYDAVGLGLPRNFLEGDKGHVCATISMLYLHPNTGSEGPRGNKLTQAMSMLALYAGEAAVTLSTRQFRLLERRVREYAGYMLAAEYEGTWNQAFAKYVLKHAVKRAKREHVI